nr:polysaccharide biosynthesis tyrosine autokinase [Pseudomonas saliphila]
MQNAVASPERNNGEIDLLALLGALLDHKWIIVACTVLFAVVGIAYALLTTPVYVATAVIQIEEKQAGISSLLGDSDLLSSASPAVTEIELLKSRTVIGQAVDNLKLTVVGEPKLFPVIGPFLHRRYSSTEEAPVADALLGFSSFAWGGEQLDVFQLDVPEPYVGRTLTLRAETDGRYTLLDAEGITLLTGAVGEAVVTDGFKVQIAELVARPGTEFLVAKKNRLGTVLTYQRSIGASEKGRDSGILSLSLESTEPQHAMRTLDEVSRLYVRQNVERKSAEAQQSLEFLQDQLPQVRRDLERAEEALNAYQASAGSVDISIETQSYLSQVVELETAISEQKMRQEELQRRFTQDHPSYQTLISQLAQLEERRARILSRVGELPDTQQELLRLARDVQVSTEIYTQMLNKSQELDVMRAGTVGNVRIIDDAAVDTTQPVKPKKPLIVVLATLLGGMLGVAIALLKHALNRGIENPEVIEQLGLPVYASVPLSKDQEVLERSARIKGAARQNVLLAKTNPADLAIEALRSLRTSLHFAMLEAKNNVLMISGPSPQVGKSFISANLAAIVAQAGQRVLLIDADMRKGYVHRLLGADANMGLSGLLAKTHTLEQVVHQTEVEGLQVISRGRIPPNPSELLMHANFEALVKQLSAQYDMVIIDTPPILAVTDAALVGRFCGTSLIVTRFGVSPAKEIQLTLQRFRNNGIEIKGAIFNAIEKKASAYGNYGYYQYEYKSDAS